MENKNEVIGYMVLEHGGYPINPNDYGFIFKRDCHLILPNFEQAIELADLVNIRYQRYYKKDSLKILEVRDITHKLHCKH